MRLIITAAVNSRGKCRYHLNHRHIKVLSERVGRKVRCSHGQVLTGCRACRIIDQTVCSRFSRQINACPESEIKQVLISGIIFFPKLCCDLHQSVIAGIFQSAFQVNNAVADLLCTPDGMTSYRLVSVTEKCIPIVYYTCLQCRSNRNRLLQWNLAHTYH